MLPQVPTGMAWHGILWQMLVKMDRVKSNSRFTLRLGWVVPEGLAVSHPATSLARASSCWAAGSPCLGAGSALQLH